MMTDGRRLDIGRKKTRYTEITLATWNVQNMLKPGRMKEIVERDLQVLGVRRWSELVAERKKWKDFFRQAKAHSGL